MTELTYGQIDKVLQALGFSCRVVKLEVKSRLYEHKETGAQILLPNLPEGEKVLPHHLATVRWTPTISASSHPQILRGNPRRRVDGFPPLGKPEAFENQERIS
jgi:hypothetical protein